MFPWSGPTAAGEGGDSQRLRGHLVVCSCQVLLFLKSAVLVKEHEQEQEQDMRGKECGSTVAGSGSWRVWSGWRSGRGGGVATPLLSALSDTLLRVLRVPYSVRTKGTAEGTAEGAAGDVGDSDCQRPVSDTETETDTATDDMRGAAAASHSSPVQTQTQTQLRASSSVVARRRQSRRLQVAASRTPLTTTTTTAAAKLE